MPCAWGIAGRPLTLEGAVSRRDLVPRELFHAEAREERTYYLLMGRYAVTTAHTVAAYGLLRDDRSPARDQSLFLGVHAHGTVRETVTYWVEFAHVRGWEGPLRSPCWLNSKETL